MTNVPLHALERSIHQFPIKKITYCSKFLRLFLHENSFITIFNCFIVALNNVTISRKSQGNAAIVIIYTISASLCDFFLLRGRSRVWNETFEVMRCLKVEMFEHWHRQQKQAVRSDCLLSPYRFEKRILMRSKRYLQEQRIVGGGEDSRKIQGAISWRGGEESWENQIWLQMQKKKHVAIKPKRPFYLKAVREF